MFDDHAAHKRVEFDVQSDVECDIWTDYSRLLQCTVLLLSNSMKYTESGSVSVLIDREIDILEVQIKDTGCGISEDDQ